MVTYVPQEHPKGCGVACVAMVVGVDYKEAVNLVGKDGCTKTRHLINALRAAGFSCPDRLQIIKGAWPNLAIAKIIVPGKISGWHWVLVSDGKILDPLMPGAWSKPPAGGRITSFLPISRKEKTNG
jgi:hypothetical protein